MEEYTARLMAADGMLHFVRHIAGLLQQRRMCGFAEQCFRWC